MPAKGESFDYHTFLKNIRSFYVSLNDNNIRNLIRKEEIGLLRTHLLQGEFRPPEFPEETPLFDLYSFLAYIAWANVVKKTRELVIEKSRIVSKKDDYSKEYLDLKPFIQTLQESRT